MLNLNNISIQFGNTAVIKGCTYTFEPNGLYFILGNNGAGKTSVLRSICGLQEPAIGNILLNGKDIYQMSLMDRSSFVQYIDNPFPVPSYINLKEYLELGYAKDSGKLQNAFESMRLEPLKDKLVDEMSRGQQQKAMLAKLVYGNQPVWLLDEPSNFLDYPSLQHFWEQIQDFSKKKLIIATVHNPEEVLKLNATILMIKKGNLISFEQKPSLEELIKHLEEE